MNTYTIDRAAERLRKLQDQFDREFPEKFAEISSLAQKLVVDPRIANDTKAWSVIWKKPLYANTKVEIAQKWRDELAPEMKSA